ncbi:hypothetical protein FPV67DRAFT_1671421 [Lyophyllum atratum]|nr:hypothetical protein FPV67DRAFT_1671421 [Lyophyllum atratum]
MGQLPRLPAPPTPASAAPPTSTATSYTAPTPASTSTPASAAPPTSTATSHKRLLFHIAIKTLPFLDSLTPRLDSLTPRSKRSRPLRSSPPPFIGLSCRALPVSAYPKTYRTSTDTRPASPLLNTGPTRAPRIAPTPPGSLPLPPAAWFLHSLGLLAIHDQRCTPRIAPAPPRPQDRSRTPRFQDRSRSPPPPASTELKTLLIPHFYRYTTSLAAFEYRPHPRPQDRSHAPRIAPAPPRRLDRSCSPPPGSSIRWASLLCVTSLQLSQNADDISHCYGYK